jgi:hypothetical protein
MWCTGGVTEIKGKIKHTQGIKHRSIDNRKYFFPHKILKIEKRKKKKKTRTAAVAGTRS